MSTQLPGFIIAGLYKDSLVLAEENIEQPLKTTPQFTNKSKTAEASPPLQNKKWFLGDNKKNIAILVKDTNAVYINDEWLGTLSKLLAACNLNLADVAIINLHQGLTFTYMQEQLKPQYILMFEVTTQEIELPFTIPHYQLQKYAGCIFMTAPVITLASVNITESIKAEKKKLWEKLKNIFNIV